MACKFQVEVQTQDGRLETTNGDQWQKGHLIDSCEIKKYSKLFGQDYKITVNVAL